MTLFSSSIFFKHFCSDLAISCRAFLRSIDKARSPHPTHATQSPMRE